MSLHLPGIPPPKLGSGPSYRPQYPSLLPSPVLTPSRGGAGMGESGAGVGGGVTKPRQLRAARGCGGGGNDIIAGGGTAQLSPTRGLQAPPLWRTQGGLRSQRREEEQKMKSAGIVSPLLKTRVGKPFTIQPPPPTATCRCRRDLSPPTHVVAAPAPGKRTQPGIQGP